VPICFGSFFSIPGLYEVIHYTLSLMLKTSKEQVTQKACTNTPSLVHVPKALIKEREYSCVIAAQRSARTRPAAQGTVKLRGCDNRSHDQRSGRITVADVGGALVGLREARRVALQPRAGVSLEARRAACYLRRPRVARAHARRRRRRKEAWTLLQLQCLALRSCSGSVTDKVITKIGRACGRRRGPGRRSAACAGCAGSRPR